MTHDNCNQIAAQYFLETWSDNLKRQLMNKVLADELCWPHLMDLYLKLTTKPDLVAEAQKVFGDGLVSTTSE